MDTNELLVEDVESMHAQLQDALRQIKDARELSSRASEVAMTLLGHGIEQSGWLRRLERQVDAMSARQAELGDHIAQLTAGSTRQAKLLALLSERVSSLEKADVVAKKP